MPSSPNFVFAGHYRATRFVWDTSGVDSAERAVEDLGAELVAPNRREGRLAPVIDQTMALASRLIKSSAPLITPAVIPKCDVFIYQASLPGDLAHLQRLKDWRKAGLKILLVHELWGHHIKGFANLINVMKDFDAIFTPMPFLAARLGPVIGKPLHYLHRGVDVLAHTPRSLYADRPIDVYAMGRRSPVLHQQFLAAMKREEIHYMYDSFDGGMGWVKDCEGHRTQIRALMKRTKFLPTYGVKAFDHAKKQDAQGEEDTLVLRYFEAAASGCLMFGDPCAELFPFDAVLPMAPDCADALDILLSAWADQSATIARRRTVLAHALRNFDIAHRFAKILETVGVAPPEALTRRLQALETRARQFEAEPASGVAQAKRA